MPVAVASSVRRPTRTCAGARHECPELHVAYLDVHTALGEIGLHELFEGVIATPDGRHFKGQLRAVSGPPSIQTSFPSGRVEE